MRQYQLRPPFLSCFQFILAQQPRTRQRLKGAAKKFELHVVRQWLWRIGQPAQAHVNQFSWRDSLRRSDDIAALQLVRAQATQVDGEAPPRRRDLHFCFVALQATNARGQACWLNHHLLPNAERAIEQRAGDDGTEARHREHAINGQAWLAPIASWRGVREQIVQRLFERVESLSFARGDRDDVRARECRRRQYVANVVAHQL